MHLLVRERASLDEATPAADLGLAPARVVFLSFSDSDLALVRAAADATGIAAEAAPLARLVHPMSVDLFVDATVAGSGIVVLRLLGGLDWWRYGAEELAAACRRHAVPFVAVAGCGREDPRLAALSTVGEDRRTRLEAMLREGGAENAARALRLAASIEAGGPDDGETAVPGPECGLHDFAAPLAQPERGRATLVFYRSHAHAGDLAPLEAMAQALGARGIATEGIFVASPKAPGCAAFLRARLRETAPDLVLNATAFSARDPVHSSPLDAAGRPVLQLIVAGSDRAAWEGSSRGLSPSDLAMQVVLPELDGRLSLPAIGHKAETPSGRRGEAYEAGVALAADRCAGWIGLARRPVADRRIAIVLSDYPGAAGEAGHMTGHAVGLDTFRSLAAILRLLLDEGYGTATPDEDALVASLTGPDPEEPVAPLDLESYAALFAALPAAARAAIVAAHGAPRAAPRIRALVLGRVVVAIQPDRSGGAGLDRRRAYHDAEAAPGHDYVGFHLWLGEGFRADAIVHLGTHGTLEFLPGKAAALGPDCMPAALLGRLPVIYPFIVNNPGEAAVARRRLGAVTIGHLTPPLLPVTLGGEAREIERLLDEYAEADGLDRRRATLLSREILGRAEASGLLAEAAGAGERDPRALLAGLDAYLCDVKELRIGDGLHVFGAPCAGRAAMLETIGEAHGAALDACGAMERQALLAALDGRFVQPGPAGAPSRGRADVLPTGRNLTTTDPRALPTASAMTLARRTARTLLERHLLDEGAPLACLVLDLWGSASLRTGGEDLALAFVLLGADPAWDEAGRLTAVELVSLAALGRPRVDVTLRISGVFRDAFETQVALFDRAVRLAAGRDESAADNPLAGLAAPLRVFGPAPGRFGTTVGSWAADSAYAYGANADGVPAAAALAGVLGRAQAFLHQQDHRETDILDGPDHAAHVGGFAAASRAAGAAPALWHADITGSGTDNGARLRSVRDEIARVTRGRLANPDWLAAMRRHGFSGASEMARGVEALADFARALPDRLDAQLELACAAILGDAENAAFLARANPDADRAIRAALAAMIAEGKWQPRRNDTAVLLR